jgi:hypothetical protein
MKAKALGWAVVLQHLKDPKRRYILAVIVLCLMGTGVGAMVSPLTFVRINCSLMFMTLAVILWLFLRGMSLEKTIHIGSLLAVAYITVVSCQSHSIYSPLQNWLLLLCVTQFYINGPRVGNIWMWISLLSLMITAAARLWWAGPTVFPIGLSQANLSFADAAIVALAILIVPWLYSRRYGEALTTSQLRQQQLQLKQLELEQTLLTREYFIASVSHELRTPMNAILGLNSLLLERVQGKPQAHQVLTYTRQSADHLMTVINDVLDYSQLSSGRLLARPEALNLQQTVYAAFQMFKPQVENTALSYDCTIDPTLPAWILADRHRLVQILVNLLGNAIKFTHQGGVTLQVRPQGALIEFNVRDTGIGMTAQQQARVFERYRQADLTTQSQYGGNGLGLTISDQLAHMMGGSLRVESHWGQGSCFKLCLPLVTAKAPLPVASQEAMTSGFAQGRWRFLVVDDHPLNRLLVRQVLQSHWPNAHIAEVEDGAQAVQACEQGPPWDAVLMDMVMPAMDGIEATLSLKSSAQKAVRATPVIGLTANVNAQDLARFKQAGLDALLLKPFEPEGLRHELEQLLRPRMPEPEH